MSIVSGPGETTIAVAVTAKAPTVGKSRDIGGSVSGELSFASMVALVPF
jgi:hypothetical protein